MVGMGKVQLQMSDGTNINVADVIGDIAMGAGEGSALKLNEAYETANQSKTLTINRTKRIVNVSEFGVIENDGKDYTVQMQNAIDYAIEKGLVLQSNPGTVNISGEGLVIWRPLNWEGAKGRSYSFNPTIIKYNGNKAAITFRKKDAAKGDFIPDDGGQLAAPNIKGITIVRDFSKDETASMGYGNKGYGIDFYRTSEGLFEDCTVTGFKVGIHAQALSITEFIKCDVKMNMYGVWLATGAENGSRFHHNSKNTLRDCNFYINYEAHVLPGYYQTNIDNCHMELSKRTFYFNMNANFRNVDTFSVFMLNANNNVPVDQYYTGGYPNIENPVFLDIQFDNSSAIVMDNIVIENSRIRSVGDTANIIKLTHNGNTNSGVNIEWKNNKLMGVPLGILKSSSPYQPVLKLDGLNKFKKHDDSNYTEPFNFKGEGGTVIGTRYDAAKGYTEQIELNSVKYRTSTASPLNAINPLFVGEELLDTNTKVWYKAFDETNSSWRPNTLNYRSSNLDPVGNTSPRYIGEEYLNLSSKSWFKATGLTNTDWKQISN